MVGIGIGIMELLILLVIPVVGLGTLAVVYFVVPVRGGDREDVARK